MGDLRMPSTNHIVLAGRLTRDVDLKYLPSGTAVAQLTIANSQHFKDKQGEKSERTTFIDVKAWGSIATYASDNLRKGTPIMVEGRIESESWEDKTTGQKRSKIMLNASSITALEWGSKSSSAPASHDDAPPSDYAPNTSSDDAIPDDDIPF